MIAVMEHVHRPKKAFLRVIPLSVLCLALILSIGCGLIGGGSNGGDQTPNKVTGNVTDKPALAAGAKVPAGPKPPAPAPAPAPPEKTADELALEKLKAVQEEKEKEFEFSRIGKVDPFYPIEAVIIAAGPPEGDEGTVPEEELTPLQRLALTQLRLVAVVMAGDRTRAMVEDATGTGYIIRNGTKVGQRNGVVTDIQPGVVTIEEKFKDRFTNQEKSQASVLKLQRKEGESK